MNKILSTLSTKCYELANTLYMGIGNPNPTPYLRGIWDHFLSAITTVSSYFSWSERTVIQKKTPDTPTTRAVSRAASSVTPPPEEEQSATADECPELDPVDRNIAKEYERMLNDLPNKSRRLLSELLTIAEARQVEFGSDMLNQLIRSLELLLDPNTGLDNRIVDERRILSDGNCLFNAVLGGLHDHGLERESEHQTLRLMAITHLKAELEAKPEEIATFLTGAIMGYQEAKRESLEMEKIFLQNYSLECQNEERVQIEAALTTNAIELRKLEEMSARDYLELAEKDGFFCGETELAALGKILDDVVIHVHNRISDLTTSYGEGNIEIHILYNGQDHYDRYLVADPE